MLNRFHRQSKRQRCKGLQGVCAVLACVACLIGCFAADFVAYASPTSFITSSNAQALPQKGEALVLDESKIYKIYDAYDQEGNELDAHSDNSRLMFNNGGNRVGWIKYGNTFTRTAAASYLWRATSVNAEEKTFMLRSQDALAAQGIVADAVGERLNNGGAQNFVVTRKGNLTQGSPLKFIVMAVENGKTYVKIEQAAYHDESGVEVSSGRCMSTEDVNLNAQSDPRNNGVRSYVTWVDSVSDTDRRSGWWVIEEVGAMPGAAEGAKLMFATSAQKVHYRIPALATSNKGEVLLFSDYRYDSPSDIGTNWGGWNGVDGNGYRNIGHRIDQVVRSSKDNGDTWDAERNITNQYTYKGTPGVKLANGYGDPAVVADRESDKVLMIAVGGSYGFHQDYPGVISMLSQDGGKTFEAPRALGGRTTGPDALAEIPQDLGIYALDNGGSHIYSMFMTSGRMHQSRYIKVGSHYRIYGVVLAKVRETREYKNFVLYSDDFGNTWHFLPGEAINGGDEAKVDELPNGDVVVTSRINGGRKVNVFSYDKSDAKLATGTWGTQSSFTIPGAQAQVNGDFLIVYAKNKESGAYGFLALQSFVQGRDRRDVRVYYKWLDESSLTPEGFAQGFSADQSYVLSKNLSAYSVMTLFANGKLGFAWEEGGMSYNISYASIPLETITNNKFSLAFESGIGSAASPFKVQSEEQLEARKNVYAHEGMNFELPKKNEEETSSDTKPTDDTVGADNPTSSSSAVQDTGAQAPQAQTKPSSTPAKLQPLGVHASNGEDKSSNGQELHSEEQVLDTLGKKNSSEDDTSGSTENKELVVEVVQSAHEELKGDASVSTKTHQSIPQTGDTVIPQGIVLFLVLISLVGARVFACKDK